MKARLLFVSPEFPYPPVSGGRLRTLSLLKYLARDFEIHCVTFAEGQPARKDLEALRAFLAEITVLPLQHHRRTTLGRYARNVGRALKFIPPLVDRFAAPHTQSALSGLLENHVGWVWLEHLWLAPYVESIPSSATKVLDVHNVESDFYRQLRRASRHPFDKLGYYVFEHAARRIERRFLALFDRVLTVSDEDRQLLARDCSADKIFVVPNAVQLVSPPTGEDRVSPTLYFAGRLDYPPNRAAVVWFYQRVWPRIRSRLPEVRWTIVGACPESLDSTLRLDPSIILAGQVETSEPYLHACGLAIVPLTVGGGTRFKILEAWTAGKAVISTAKGAEGLACRHGDNIWIANTSQEFGDGVLRLLADHSLRARLGERGWQTVKEQYSWERLHERLESALRMPQRN